MSTLLIQGMHGLGDNLHQRAVIRQLMKTHDVVLETSWASLYHDLVTDGLRLVRRQVALRTQTKNAQRESSSFLRVVPKADKAIRISYHGPHVMKTKSQTVLEAMCNATGTDYALADYRLPVPEEWFNGLEQVLSHWRASGKPLLVYRPLVARPEWRGSVARNADPASYARMVAAIRDEFYVISVADLAPGKEWIVGPQLHADLALHSGELTFEAMAALFSAADLIFTSSGFAAILGPAVGTPVVNIVGGYENANCHASGERFVPMFTVGPRRPCSCWSSACTVSCDKRIDIATAIPELQQFVAANVDQLGGLVWADVDAMPIETMFAPAVDPSHAEVRIAPPRQSESYLTYIQQIRAKAAAEAGGEKA